MVTSQGAARCASFHCCCLPELDREIDECDESLKGVSRPSCSKRIVGSEFVDRPRVREDTCMRLAANAS